MSPRLLCSLLFGITCVGFSAASQADPVEFPHYVVKRWAEPGFTRHYMAWGMNAFDEVVGSAWQGAPDFDTVGFRASRSKGLLKVDGINTHGANPRYLTLQAINDVGEAVGNTTGHSDKDSAVLVTADGQRILLDTALLPGASTQATAINSAGTVVGSGTIGPFGAPYPLIWEGPDHTPRQMVFPSGMKYGTPEAINQQGHAAGELGESPGKGFLWTGDGQVSEIPQVIYVHGMNDHDAVVGQRSGHWGFVWTPDAGMQKLPHLPRTNQCDAYSIDNDNTIVGFCGYYNGEVFGRQHAAIWIKGDGGWQVADLTELVAGPHPKHDLSIALKITAKGHILVQRDTEYTGNVDGPLVLVPERTVSARH